MNKQVVIAGLLGAIAGQINEVDPTPCEDISTRAAFVAHGLAAEAKAAWEGKIEALESAASDDGAALEDAVAALADVTGIVQPYLTALNTATQNNTNAGNVKTAAQNLLDDINAGTANTIDGDSMLLGVLAPDVGTAQTAVTDAQSAYDTKFAQINDATFTDTAGTYGTADATLTGFRAVLTGHVQTQSLMLDAQSTASTAEGTAITAYTDQEAVVNALYLIEGCKTAVYADLSADDQTAYTNATGDAAAQAALLEAKFAECCTTRLTTFIATLAVGDPNYGDTNTAGNAIDCAVNSGFNMYEELGNRDAAQILAESTYTGSCTQTNAAGPTVPVNCDTQAAYTDYKTRFAAAKKAERMRDAVDHACTDFFKADSATATYDCSNGILSNTASAIFTWDNMTADNAIAYHFMNPLTGTADQTAQSASVDPIWVYRETLNTASAASTYEGVVTGTDDYLTLWQTLIGTVSTNQVAWTLAEAKYWAYKQTAAINTALATTADTSEAALLVTKEQKVDLLDAADADVDASALLVAMATSDLADEVAALATLQATLVAAEEAHAVQVYLATQAAAAALVQSNIVAGWEEQCGVAAQLGSDPAGASCTNALTQLGDLQALAQSNFDEIQVALDCNDFNGTTCTGFYATAVSEAQDMKNLSDEALSMAQGKVSEFTSSLEMLEQQYAAGVNACKGLGYDRAQAAKKQLMDLETANTAAAATVLTDYTAKSAFATTEETNTLCAYPAKVGDAAQEPRPECKDGYCCGAAQKFLKDGTKLAIETCQKAEGVHTYEYFPPLPEGSPVEPTPEIWRFQCISGAQKLAATAAAALAASYMMA